jgi:hypothetical protein
LALSTLEEGLLLLNEEWWGKREKSTTLFSYRDVLIVKIAVRVHAC